MKRIILGLMIAMLFCTSAQGKNRTVTENDSLGNKRRVIELRDAVINGKTVTDTLSIMTYESSSEENNREYDYNDRTERHDRLGWLFSDLSQNDVAATATISIIAIIFVFGMPLLIVFVIFFFRYKNRKAKYRLAEQALASGQQLPENIFRNTETEDVRTKGIKNVFLGIGLFIFLWAITGEFSLGCIGLLIMFTGFGQLVIYYSQQKKNDEK
ncbi:DUF6249 domain-containing protein [Bacteroides helcogenes]|uniref:DUF6249 domain-containing protein n=1 Tax=Bacteroides helcogenes (strain ATCC 35417 / DSM 20613 / JCM 6297 / CCUG 15421 / P 36-108) TaxID=693979 RepID=E6SSG5_BACT6|nr:DUF6249 domain-containing protein [Bacteroides helcogenes]ADV45216.1 hypothetical protein Bache_3293 [Bacteroides helcogenes P 36-108]MDY5238777.1 DUF6249 domain-containing protein [Bacteroides helcogenes]